jgi:hypothetical protein
MSSNIYDVALHATNRNKTISISVVIIVTIIAIVYAFTAGTQLLNLATAVVASVWVAGTASAFRLWTSGLKENPEYIKKHYAELRNKVFVPWVQAEIVVSKECGPNALPFTASGPIFLRSSANVYWEDAGRAYSHLKHKAYSEGKGALSKAMGAMEEHNIKANQLHNELITALEVALARYPEVQEYAEGAKIWRRQSTILQVIEENAELTQKGPDIQGGAITVAHIEDETIRTDFFRDLRSLKQTHSPLFADALDSARFMAASQFDTFKGTIMRIIKNLDAFDKLEGKCEVEERKIL